MTNYRLKIEYEGTDFSGWQRQPNRRTVQGALERAIVETVAHRVDVVGCSRTDSGVHAIGYVANFKSSSLLPPERMQGAINSRLADDVAVLDCDVVPDSFHACSDALGKLYRYVTVHGRLRPVRDRRFVNHCPYPLQIEPMIEAAAHCVGKLDFAAFVNQLDPGKDTVRTIWAVKLEETGRTLTISVLGDGFMYNMVRIIVGTLIEVGRGGQQPEWVGEALAAGVRKNAGPTADAKGLTLAEVIYDSARLDELRKRLG